MKKKKAKKKLVTKAPAIYVRGGDVLHGKVEAAANRTGQSMSKYVINVLNEHFGIK